LERQVKAMKITTARLRMKLVAKTDQLFDLRTELQEMRKDMETMEREADKKDELLDASKKDTEQYRTWWLNEVQFMKLMLNKIPEPNKDIDLVRTAQAHYLGNY
jgi:soluble cytochrome b562